MPTPIYPQTRGSTLSLTTTAAIASDAYSTDKLTIDNTDATPGLLVNFSVPVTFSSAPVAGSLQLVLVPYSLDGTTPGTAPSAMVLGKTYDFERKPGSTNTSTSIRFSLESIALGPFKYDCYLRNGSLGQPIPSGSVLTAQRWSPGT